MTEASANPFRTRTVLLLVAAGLILALGFLLVSAYGDRIDRQRGNIPSSSSRFATGYYGLTRLVELAGGRVTLSSDPTARPEAGILILTPNVGTTSAELDAALAEAASETLPVLVVLPKWLAAPQKDKPKREQRIALLPADRIAALLAPLAEATVEREKPGQLVMRTSLPIPDFVPPESLQSLRGDKLYPLIAAPNGGAVLAEIPGKHIFILSDPDLLNNHGLAHRANARAALAMLAGLDSHAPGQVVFDTMLPYGSGGRNLLQLAFEPPFAGVSIALLIAALLAGIATLVRFGPVRREARAVPFGKAALIDNIVSLARRARRTREGGPAYVDAIRDWAARRLALPRTMQGEALDAHLDAIPTTTSYGETVQRVRDAKSETELLHAAQALDDWRKEVKA